MKSSSLSQAALLGLSLVLAACGAHDGSSPQLPTSPGQSGTSLAPGGVAGLPPGASAGAVEMQAASVGPPPPGFKAVIRSTPLPGTDGDIRGQSPLTVEFDLCDSTADAGKTLFYYFDWDFNNVGDAGGTGATCRQQHTYRPTQVPSPSGDATLKSNVCVANGDVSAHSPSTFVACRVFTVVIPIQTARLKLVGPYLVHSGPSWPTAPPTYNCLEACALQYGGDASQYACSTVPTRIDNLANVSFYGGGCHVEPETFKRNTTYVCGSPCAASAFVKDWCFGGQQNYCFR